MECKLMNKFCRLTVSYYKHSVDKYLFLFLLLLVLCVLLVGTHFGIFTWMSFYRNLMSGHHQNKYQFVQTHPSALCSLWCCASARSTHLIFFALVNPRGHLSPLNTIIPRSTRSDHWFTSYCILAITPNRASLTLTFTHPWFTKSGYHAMHC